MASDILFDTWALIEKLKTNINADIQHRDFKNLKLYDLRLFQTIYNSKEPLTKIQMSRELNCSRSDITLRVDRLAKIDLIAIEKSTTDKRKQYLRFTAKSLEIVPVYMNNITAINNRISTALSEEVLAEFRITLNKINHLL